MSNYINENLLDASPLKNQQAESKKLVSKWEKTGLLDGLNEDFQKSGMAVMLENQAKQLINENSSNSLNFVFINRCIFSSSDIRFRSVCNRPAVSTIIKSL